MDSRNETRSLYLRAFVAEPAGPKTKIDYRRPEKNPNFGNRNRLHYDPIIYR